MTKYFYSFILLFSSTAISASSNWIVIDKSDESEFSIDTNSLQKSGDSVTFWTRKNFTQRRADGVLSGRDQITINCRTRDRNFKSMQTFDDNNNNGKVVNTYDGDGKWQSIPPDTIMWGYYEYVCKK